MYVMVNQFSREQEYSFPMYWKCFLPGMSIEDVLREYLQLSREMIYEALGFAAELLRRERSVIPIPA